MILDAEQTNAVRTDSRQVLVSAGPGGGKTRTIIERAAYLIEHRQVSPSELLLVTFSRKAAGEMRSRMVERLGSAAANKMEIGTFHATALKLLKRFGEFVGLNGKNLTVYGEFESNFLLKECAIDLGVYKKSWNPLKKDIDKIFSEYYETGKEPNSDNPGTPLFKEFIMRCKENRSLTYGGLLTGLKLLLPFIYQYLPWRHVIIDEGHDTDLLQIELMRMIQKGCEASLFIVLDVDQTLYGWRGACPEYWLEHQEEFELHLLTTNYRSCPEIVGAANRLIEHNTARIPRTMRATREDRGRIDCPRGMDTEMVVRLLSDLVHSQREGSAVLSRNHFLLKKLASKLDDINFPYTYVGRTAELVDSELFRRFHAFLKLLVNPFDNMSFLLIRDILGLSLKEYNEIRLRATQESKSHFQSWYDMVPPSPEDLKRQFFDCSIIFPFPLDAAKDIQNIFTFDVTEIVNFVDAWAKSDPIAPLSDYLYWLATFDIQDEVKEDDDRLKLLTGHAAKGLEFGLVIIIGANEGIIPSKQAIEAGDNEIQAERRLFYTMMTRAKDALILAVRHERKEGENGKVYLNPISRFMREIQ